jgi:hypothetical protein
VTVLTKEELNREKEKIRQIISTNLWRDTLIVDGKKVEIKNYWYHRLYLHKRKVVKGIKEPKRAFNYIIKKIGVYI